MTYGILKIFSNYSIFQGQQKYYRPKLDNTKDILGKLVMGFKVLTRKPFGGLPRSNSSIFTSKNVFKFRFLYESIVNKIY